MGMKIGMGVWTDENVYEYMFECMNVCMYVGLGVVWGCGI